MELIEHLMQYAAHLIEMVGLAVLLYAATLGIATFARNEFSRVTGKAVQPQDEARLHLGTRILFALELMIVSDLIQTVLGRTLEDLTFLAALVVIRTTVSFFLARELAGLERERLAQ